MTNIAATRLLRQFGALLQARGRCGKWIPTGPGVCGRAQHTGPCHA